MITSVIVGDSTQSEMEMEVGFGSVVTVSETCGCDDDDGGFICCTAHEK